MVGSFAPKRLFSRLYRFVRKKLELNSVPRSDVYKRQGDLFAQPLGADGVVLAEAALQGAAGKEHRAAAPCTADAGLLPVVQGLSLIHI